ncbi:reverse transcriptase domain-containing protein [Tanacetum coccineum]
MSTRSSSSNLVSPFSNPESVIRNRQRTLGDLSLLFDFEKINMANNLGPPPVGPNLQNPPAPGLRTMKGPCQPTMNGRGDDANKHLYKFLTVTQSMKQNGVTDDALCLYLFPYSLTHHATAWFDRLPKNSIHTFWEMTLKFLSKYFPLSMVTKLRNDISNFRQLLDESFFEA